MKINPDGTIFLKKGESVPFMCPKDKWPIPYDPNVVMVHCFHCGHIDTVEAFSVEFETRD